MIGCPSHRAPLGLMVFRPGKGGRRELGEQGWTGRKFSVVLISLFHLVFVLPVGFCRTLWPERRTFTKGQAVTTF